MSRRILNGVFTVTDTKPHRASTAGERGARRHASRVLILLLIAGAQLMVVLDGTIVNIALPSMGAYFDKNQTDMTWALNAYTLAFGGLLLLGGRAARHLRAAADVHRRPRAVHRRQLPRWHRDQLPVAARRPGRPGHRWRDRRAHRAVADHQRVRRGRGAQPRGGRLRGGLRRRRRSRAAARRRAHQLLQLALGAVRQRAHRHRA